MPFKISFKEKAGSLPMTLKRISAWPRELCIMYSLKNLVLAI